MLRYLLQLLGNNKHEVLLEFVICKEQQVAETFKDEFNNIICGKVIHVHG